MNNTKLTIIAALACTSASLANGQDSAQPADASASAAQLDALVGDRICTGQMPPMGDSPGRTTSGRFHGEKTLDGHWIVVHYEQDPSADNPKPFEVMQYFGYDPMGKRFISVMVGNGAGVFSVGFSPGWMGNSITFDEEESARGNSHSTREAFTTGDSGMTGYTGWFRDENGEWVKVDEETCHEA